MCKTRWLKRFTWSVTIGSLSLICINSVLAQSSRYNGRYMGWGMMDHWKMGWVGMLFMLLMWGLIIVGFIMLIKWLFHLMGRSGDSSANESAKAIAIAKKRYARGEISRDEFEAMKKDIGW